MIDSVILKFQRQRQVIAVKRQLLRVSVYRELLAAQGVAIDPDLTEDQAKKVVLTFSHLPEEFVKRYLKTLVLANLGAVHGKWEHEGKTMTINPSVFDMKKYFGGGRFITSVPEYVHVLIHELLHSLDTHFSLADSKKWLEISGWKFSPKKTPDGCARYIENRPGWDKRGPRASRWVYKRGANFVRNYAKKNPYEDYAESACFYTMGLLNSFKGQVGAKKIKFVKKVMDFLSGGDEEGLKNWIESD